MFALGLLLPGGAALPPLNRRPVQAQRRRAAAAVLFFRWRIAFDMDVFTLEQEVHHPCSSSLRCSGFIMLSFFSLISMVSSSATVPRLLWRSRLNALTQVARVELEILAFSVAL